jgi:eukaryotic-like serine/threonine-protein kinase
MADQQQGERIAGKYELVAPLGEGGMASVWRGLTRGACGFSRKVAIKRVLPGLARNGEFTAMFVEEARVVSELQHPNIVQVHDFDRDEKGALFIVMEWVEGVDLQRWVLAYDKENEDTPWPIVTAIGIEVLRALGAAHERTDEKGRPAPVVHRDVNPANILMGVNGIVKLADFGLARAKDRASMTSPGIVKGKLSYLAPETAMGAAATPASDLYSVGIVLWESLSRKRLFAGKGPGEVIMKVREGKIQPLGELRPELPPLLCEVVHTALAKEPGDRFHSADEMRRTLTSILRNHPEPTDARMLGNSVKLASARLNTSK